ncbi:hypothetical protein K443DRAFT_107911 [Laccaria amethystina LaAM-08-1]|uniref:Uncharacterized protein n=1 Tax=Laccaria amethystina LaAM-08-1 TaxID=1095629 RepID=A0A0C9XIM6_9AGAR|nr:hypothetical protein K443DRAFT_107911 [Laccaria amethystina LaAM-08-1]
MLWVLTGCKSASGWSFLLVADKSMLWVLNRIKSASGWSSLVVVDKSMVCVLNSDVLNYTDCSSVGNTKTFENIAFLCITTAIIAEHSYFMWKQKPSASSVPFKLAVQKFNSSADLKKIKTAIEDASHLKIKDQKHALVKIALENCLRELLIP